MDTPRHRTSEFRRENISVVELPQLETHFLVDCRWLGQGGAGRVTEWFLRGAAQLEPRGRWSLLGPSGVRAHLWAGASHYQNDSQPKALLGQRAATSLPRSDISLFFHQIRPVTGNPSVTVMYDTIPLRFGPRRRLKRIFYRSIAGVSRRIVTMSRFSRDRLVEDLGIAPNKIEIVAMPVDDEFVDRINRKRAREASSAMLLYVGRFAPHKNLARLIEGFRRSSLFRDGGRLALVGGSPSEVTRLTAQYDEQSIEIAGITDQQRLEELYGSCAAVVMPSLEEGFGLPAWEAMMCSIPVCVSDRGALPEITQGLVEPFPALSTGAIASAIDRAVAELGTTIPSERARQLTQTSPRLDAFAQSIIDVLKPR